MSEHGNQLTEKSEQIELLENEIAELRVEVKHASINTEKLEGKLLEDQKYSEKMEEKLADAGTRIIYMCVCVCAVYVCL